MKNLKICITSGIGGGKSTILKKLKNEFGFKIFEQDLTEINMDLKIFYEMNMINFYKIQDLFQKMYQKLYKQAINEYNLGNTICIEELIGTFKIFTENGKINGKISDNEYNNLKELYNNRNLPTIDDFDYVIFLKTNSSKINLDRIKQRSMNDENIKQNYIQEINDRYENFYQENKHKKGIYQINTSNLNINQTISEIIKFIGIDNFPLTLYQQFLYGFRKFDKPKIINIDGLLAVGKSTIINLFLEIGFNIYQEDLNPNLLELLKKFYLGEKSLAYLIEKNFLSTYKNQWINRNLNNNVIYESILGAEVFINTYYQEGYLTEKQKNELIEGYKNLEIKDIINIILIANMDTLFKRIKERNREGEGQITKEHMYLLDKNFNTIKFDIIINIENRNPLQIIEEILFKLC